MKKMIVAFLCGLWMLFGCVSSPVNAPAGNQVDKQAMCVEAQSALAAAVEFLGHVEYSTSDPRVTYWKMYAEGARLAIDIYCSDK